MKKNILLQTSVIIITLLFSNCANNNYKKLLYDANIKKVDQNYKQYIERYNNLIKCNKDEEVLDSIINKIVAKTGFDIVFILEFRNPPSYECYGFLWNNKKIYEFSNRNQYIEKYSDNVSKKYKHINDYMLLIEKWNEDDIIGMSYKKPLSWDSYSIDEKREVVANRLIFKDKKCIGMESIIFNEIDFDSTINPTIIE